MKIAGRAGRAPGQHALWRSIGAHSEREPAAALREGCRDLRQRLVLSRIAIQGGETADEAVDIAQVMGLIGQIENALLRR